MGSVITAIRCANCDRELQEHERPCPSCGGQNRIYDVHGDLTITLSVSSKGNLTDETGFKRVEFKSCSKISRETRRRTEEYLLIDHRHPKMTKKYHRVEEANDDGEMIIVHQHEETFPAKRRPLKPRGRNGE